MAPLMLFSSLMRWHVLLVGGFLTMSLGWAQHALSAPPAGATAEPRFIREAQRALGELGFRPGPVDGVVGRKTRDALARYQRSQKIPVTGSLDTETMVRLDIHERVSGPAARLEGEAGRTFEATARAAR